MITSTKIESTISATLLATWLSVSSRQAHRLIKRYRNVYAGDDLTQAEADHLIRARTCAARENIGLEAAFKTTETDNSVPDSDVKCPPELPHDLENARGHELFPKLMDYLESHARYYAAWEARLQKQEAEVRGIRDELEAVRAQIVGLTSGVHQQQAKIHNQVAASLRRTHKKGARA